MNILSAFATPVISGDLIIATILFVVVQKRSCQVVTRYQVYTMTCSLMALLDELPAEDFIQVHRAVVVNMKYVTGLSRDHIFIHEHCLPVGRTHYDDLHEIFTASFKKRLNKLPLKTRSGSVAKIKRVKTDTQPG